MTKFLEFLEPLYRIIGSAFLTIGFFFGLLGWFILDMYKFNVENKVLDSFPSQFIITFYFAFACITAFVITIMTLMQQLAYRKSDTNQQPNISA